MEYPPPIVDSAKVVAFATVDDTVVRVRNDLLYVGGEPLGPAAKLAICKSPCESEYRLCFCNNEWEVLGCCVYDSVEAAKQRAEKEYRGLFGRWQPFHHEDEAAIDRQCLEPFCSFCGKSCFEVERMIKGRNAWICFDCVRVFGGSFDDES